MANNVFLQRLLAAVPSTRVKILEPEKVERKLQKLVQGGLKGLHLITDFDHTLTKYWHEGKRSVSSHGIIARSSKTDPKFKQRTEALYNKYYPIEVDSKLSIEAKIPFMVEWWEKAHDIIVEMGITKQDIRDMIQENSVVWRGGIHKLMQYSCDQNVPMLVFSAGIANIIEEAFRESQLLLNNVHVISNQMQFSPVSGKVESFDEPIIHVFNKSEASLNHSTSYFSTVLHRRNVVLMGDSVGDLAMADGLQHEVCLTLGYLNHDQDTLIANYETKFDIVILDDAPLDLVTVLMEMIAKEPLDLGVVN